MMHKIFLAFVVAMLGLAFLPGASEARTVSPRGDVQDRYYERQQRYQERIARHEERVKERYERHQERLQQHEERVQKHYERREARRDRGDDHTNDDQDEPHDDDIGQDGDDGSNGDEPQDTNEPELTFWSYPEGPHSPDDKVSLEWESEYADTCTATDGWNGDKQLSGMEYVMPAATTKYTLTCENESGEITRMLTIDVVEEDDNTATTTPPTDDDTGDGGGGPIAVSLEFNGNPLTITNGSISTLTWNSQYADECIASGGWTDEQELDGTLEVSPSEDTTYILMCSNNTSEETKEVTIMVEEEVTPTPTLSISVAPEEITEGELAVLSWDAANVDQCFAFGSWDGEQALTGAIDVGPLADAAYTLTCTGEYGEVSDSVSLTVLLADDDDTNGGDDGSGGGGDDGSNGDDGADAAGLLITEVLYDPGDGQGSEGDNEWVEIYNGTGATVDLTDWKLRDGGGNEDTLGAISLADGAYLIVSGATTTANFWTFPAGTQLVSLESPIGNGLGNTGDGVILVAADDTIVDGVSWGDDTASVDPPAVDVSESHSLERCALTNDTDTAADWTDQDAPTPGSDGCEDDSDDSGDDGTDDDTSTTTPPTDDDDDDTGTTTPPTDDGANTTGLVLINEVYYDVDDAHGTESTNEWIELYNPGTDAIDLNGWTISDSASGSTFGESTVIGAGEFLVLAESTTTADFWAIPSPVALISLPSLNNGGDAVILTDGAATQVDAMSWGSNTDAFDPAANDVVEGHSLERCLLGTDTDSASDWQDREIPSPGVSDCSDTSDDDNNNDDDTGTTTPPVDDDSDVDTTGLVLINEVYYDVDDAHGTESANEWIELYNPGSADINLQNWNINDGGAGSTFGEGVVIGAGEFLVVAESTTTASFWTISSPVTIMSLPSLGNTGDALYLIDGTATQIDAMSWGSNTDVFDPSAPDVAEGHSLERCDLGDDTDNAEDWVDLETPSPGTSDCTETDSGDDEPADGGGGDDDSGTTTPSTGNVLISEVYYDVDDTHGNESTNEWVELYNAGTEAVDLGGWSLSDASSVDVFPTDLDLILGPGEYFVVTNNSSTLDFWTFPAVTVLALNSSIGNSLGNTGDTLTLSNATAEVVDALSWGANTDAFDPSAPDVAEGHSLARDSVTTDTDTAADWVDLETPTPGV